MRKLKNFHCEPIFRKSSFSAQFKCETIVMMHSNLALFTQRRNIFIEELKGIQSWTVQSLKLFHHDQQISIVSAFANSR